MLGFFSLHCYLHRVSPFLPCRTSWSSHRGLVWTAQSWRWEEINAITFRDIFMLVQGPRTCVPWQRSLTESLAITVKTKTDSLTNSCNRGLSNILYPKTFSFTELTFLSSFKGKYKITSQNLRTSNIPLVWHSWLTAHSIRILVGSFSFGLVWLFNQSTRSQGGSWVWRTRSVSSGKHWDALRELWEVLRH